MAFGSLSTVQSPETLKRNLKVSDYATLRTRLTNGVYKEGDTVTVTNSGVYGSGVIKSGSVTDDKGTLITTDGGSLYWARNTGGASFASWFGAIGDGSTDDTTALQDLLNSTTEKEVRLNPEARYKISASISNSVADRIIFGYGATIEPTSTIAGTRYCIENSASRIKIYGVKIAGVAGTTLCGGIQLSIGDGCEITGCSFSDLDNGGGIVTTSAAVGHAINDNYMTNCAPVALGGRQFGAIHCNATKSVITSNRLINCGQTGISSINPISINISQNYIDGQNNAASGGIILDAAGNSCVLSSNIIKDVKVEGIQIANSVSGQASEDHTVIGNTIVSTRAANDGPVSGITIVASGTGTVERINITGNVMRSDDRDSTSSVKLIDIDGAVDTNIAGNTLEGGWVGVGFTSSSVGASIVGNTFRNQNTTAISCTSGGKECLIANNKISGDGTSGSTTGITFNAGVGGGQQLIIGNQFVDLLVGISGTFSGTERSYIKDNHFIRCGTNHSLTSNIANSLSGNVYDSLARSGEATLVAGTVTVSAANLRATDRIRLDVKTTTGNEGALYIDSRTNSSGFVISSTNSSDTSVVTWELDG